MALNCHDCIDCDSESGHKEEIHSCVRVKERDYKIKEGAIKCQDIVGTVSFCRAL